MLSLQSEKVPTVTGIDICTAIYSIALTLQAFSDAKLLKTGVYSLHIILTPTTVTFVSFTATKRFLVCTCLRVTGTSQREDPFL